MANFYKSALLCLVLVITVVKGYPGAGESVPEEPCYDPEADVRVLKNAIDQGDSQQIIEIVTKRTRDERLRIVSAYKGTWGDDLIETLKSALTGNFESIIVALMTPLYDYYAQQLHDAVEGGGTDEDTIVEILSTLENDDIRDVKNSYERLYEKSLENDLIRDTSDDFQRLIVALVQVTRDESLDVDEDAAHLDARCLHRAGEGKWGTDECDFIRIIAGRSRGHLLEMFAKYKEEFYKDIESVIEDEFSGDVKKLLLGVVKCTKSKVDYLAERIHGSVAGWGTDDETLVRIIVTRSESDLPEIIKAYDLKYGESFRARIEGDTSDEYRQALLSIVTEVVNRHADA